LSPSHRWTHLYRRMFRNSATLSPVENQVLVSAPPALPPGAQRQVRVGLATDSNDNFAVTWTGTVNDAGAQNWNVFARSFSSAGAALKDFRVDLAPRSAGLQAARIARSSQSGKFAYAWRDNRSGFFDVYTRVLGSLQ
jgi:hypothetical protein